MKAIVVYREGKMVGRYRTYTAAAKAAGVDSSTLWKALKKRGKYRARNGATACFDGNVDALAVSMRIKVESIASGEVMTCISLKAALKILGMEIPYNTAHSRMRRYGQMTCNGYRITDLRYEEPSAEDACVTSEAVRPYRETEQEKMKREALYEKYRDAACRGSRCPFTVCNGSKCARVAIYAEEAENSLTTPKEQIV